jgi:uncharacterized protein YndB with AHSA1/START domain
MQLDSCALYATNELQKGGAVEVTREIVLPAAPDEVWEALTDPERLSEWFANDVEFDARPGGRGVFRWDDGETRHATVDDVVPGERLGFAWADGDGAESHVTIALEEAEQGTRLRVVETASVLAGEWAVGLEVQALAAVAVR